MGHDISGYNKAGEEIAYARFSMGNLNATILYDLLNSREYYAGVSGSGQNSTITLATVQKALDNYYQLFKENHTRTILEQLPWDQRQIFSFIHNCLLTAQKEGDVRVYFG